MIVRGCLGVWSIRLHRGSIQIRCSGNRQVEPLSEGGATRTYQSVGGAILGLL